MYALDLVATLILFLSACFLAGRVWRFPFDDELFTLTAVERRHSIWEISVFFLKGGDVHPPLSYLLFYVLDELGGSEAAMRLFSLGMTALSLALFQILALGLIAQRTGARVQQSTRLITIMLFGLSPLALGQGDAIRWYPLFALLFSLFCVAYLTATCETTRLWSAVPLGLAASTDFIVASVIAPFLVYRYALERRFRPGFEATYWLIFSLFAGLGFYSAYSLATAKLAYVVADQFGSGRLRAVASTVLGFFGGDALGVSQAWAVLPVTLVAAVALFSEIYRNRPAEPVHFLLLIVASAALVVLAGFGKPRSFLYLAPVLAAILTLFIDRQRGARRFGWTALMVSLILIPSVGAIANLNHGTRPFKRNSAIPFQEVLDFIRSNATGNVLIVSTDPVVVWVLQHEREQQNRCISYFTANAECFAPSRHYDSVITVVGHSDRSANRRTMQALDAVVNAATAGKEKIAELHAGLDEDAAIKSKLTGVQLDQFILSVGLYR